MAGSIIFNGRHRENLATMRLDVGLQEFLGVHINWDEMVLDFAAMRSAKATSLGYPVIPHCTM